MIRKLLILPALALAAPSYAEAQSEVEQCDRELVVLGAGQDAGAPQIGNPGDEGPRLLPSSLGLIDREAETRYMFDATPAITEQFAILDAIEPPRDGLGIDGIFLTHAHIGHYLGLAYLGREAAGAKDVPVLAMQRMAEFLRKNGPWSQLADLGNISVLELTANSVNVINDVVLVSPLKVPHRDEFSETVGFDVAVPNSSFLYLPDIDFWPQDGGKSFLLRHLPHVEYAFVDATFWDDNELPGRDMSEIPHPRVTATMDMLQSLPVKERAKIHFIHYNHTNPIRDPESAQSKEVLERGFNIARRGDRICLD